ncbi:MAG TPA: efflux RND transporter periplasmic adaptor subunit [Blastocatellia bacterium]|nr:efflux RND transporter periplasmic adaptor subunit [Blastocatellia bacterium]
MSYPAGGKLHPRTRAWSIPKSIQELLLICALILAGMWTASCSRGVSGKQVDGSPQKPTPARMLIADTRQVRRNIEAVGSLFPYEEVAVSSEVEGRVDQVLVDVGDRVSAGQPIVRIVATELQLTVEQQRAAVNQARARLGLASEGEDLKDVRAAAEVKRAAADLDDAQQKFERSKTLYASGLLPKQNYDEAESRYNAARAAYDLSVQTVQNLRGQLAQTQASAALAQKKLSDSVIRAPFAGQVKERTVAQGQYLKVQTPVMMIVNIDPLRVRLKVPEKMAAWAKTGQEVTVSVEAFPDRTFAGKIWRINPAVDQQTRTFEVEALIDNHDNALKPGFFVKATIPSAKVDEALLVPQDALLYVYGAYKVFVIEGDILKEREVKLGERSGDEVEIVEGLNRGERLALPVKGRELKDGATVEIVNQEKF